MQEPRELLPALTPYFVMKVGHVPLIRYRPGDPEAAEQVAQAIGRYGEAGTPIRAVMLERLGPNVWHDSPAAAMATLEELEETARLMHLCAVAPAPLTESQLEELRHTLVRTGTLCPNLPPTCPCSIPSLIFWTVEAAAQDGFKAVEYLFPCL